MKQLELTFESKSPVNKDRLSKQNKFLYDHLASGKTITSKEAMLLYGITRLGGRIHEIRKMATIYDKFIDVDGVKFKEYSLFEFKNQVSL